MKVYLFDREWYPVYDIEYRKEYKTYPVDLPEELINEYIETKVKMEIMLGKIETYIEEQGGINYEKE
jgi:hypothetical protein